MLTLFVVFGGICIAIMAGAGLAWVLSLFGVVKLNPEQAKVLNRVFGGGLLGALATAGGALFTLPKDEPWPGPIPTPTFTPTPTSTPTPTAKLEDPPTDAPPAEPALPDAVRDFLSANNLTRPGIDRQWAKRYPMCAKQARTKALPPPDARQCFDELDQFNTAVLRPYQEAYKSYVPRISELSYSQPAGDVLDFLQSEARGLTNGTHEVAAVYRSISKEMHDDYARLRGQAYK
jgi:hypothetical protein